MIRSRRKIDQKVWPRSKHRELPFVKKHYFLTYVLRLLEAICFRTGHQSPESTGEGESMETAKMWWVRKRVCNDVVAFLHQADDKKVHDDMDEADSMEVHGAVDSTSKSASGSRNSLSG